MAESQVKHSHQSALRPLSRLYCPVQTSHSLIRASERGVGLFFRLWELEGGGALNSRSAWRSDTDILL